MANAVVPWDQRPEYLAYTDWTPIPGVTSYAVPHNGSGTNVTQFHPGHAFLSEYNMPDIMYQLHPCDEWNRFKKSPLPGFKYNPDGTPVYEQWTKEGEERQPLRDFKILPDKISNNESWWYLEFLRRMDPRISQRDIIMREEISEERLRINNDQRYINIHLNTPGYRTYRPAWKMIAWHPKGASAKENFRRQFVLNSLTDAQKNANTTRGSTPGLINPALGDVPGNRIALPVLIIRKRGPQRKKVDANTAPATQQAQPGQAPQVPGLPGAAQAPRARKARKTREAPQALNQEPQAPLATQDGNSYAAAALFPEIPTTMGAPSQDFSSVASAQEPNDLQGYSNTEARDAAAMPPPPLPFNRTNGHFPHPQEFGVHLENPFCNNWLPEFEDMQADVMEVEDSTATNHVPEPEYPFMSDEEIATISTKSKEAIKEIHRIAEPFLGPSLDLQSRPPMDLSGALIKEMGLDWMAQKQASGKMQEKGKGNARPTPAQTVPAQNVAPQATPMLPVNRGVKRKGHDGENENFQHVQLDVEKQDSRPRKQVKSVHHANLQNGNGTPYRDAAYNAQQQYVAPATGYLQSDYGYGPGFGGPALQGAQTHWGASVEDANTSNGGGPAEEQNGIFTRQQANQISGPSHHQNYPPAPFETNVPEHQPLRQPHVASPYVPAPTAGDQAPHYQTSNLQPGGSVEKSPFGDTQAGHALGHQSSMFPSTPNAQPVGHQSTAGQRRSRADRGNHREMLEHTSNTHRFHPYANSRRGNAQSVEASQVQQLDGGDQLQPAWTPVAQVKEPYFPEMIPSSSDNNPSPNSVPGFPLSTKLEDNFAYVNDDPGQGIDFEGTQKVRDWILTGR